MGRHLTSEQITLLEALEQTMDPHYDEAEDESNDANEKDDPPLENEDSTENGENDSLLGKARKLWNS